jgi:hypothetical protein
VTKPGPVSLSGESTYNPLSIHIDGQLCFTRYFFHNPAEEPDTEESANEDNASDHVKEEPTEDEVPLFIPPDSPRPNLDHERPINLDSLPHSDWIKLEPTDASMPQQPSDTNALPPDDDYETDHDEPVEEEDKGWFDLFEAQRKPGNSQSTLKSDEVYAYLI